MRSLAIVSASAAMSGCVTIRQHYSLFDVGNRAIQQTGVFWSVLLAALTAAVVAGLAVWIALRLLGKRSKRHSDDSS